MAENRWLHLQHPHSQYWKTPRLCFQPSTVFSVHTHNRVAIHESNTVVKFADDTVVVGSIIKNDEKAYVDEVEQMS